MDIDFDDLISTNTANTAKADVKFQPKGRPKLKPKPKPNSQPEPKPTPSTQFVEGETGNDVNKIIGNVIDNLESSSTKSSHEKNAESLDSPNDFVPDFTTPVNLAPSMDVGPAEPELMNNIGAKIDNNNNDFDFVPENDSLVESKSKSKSKKPVKKRKKVQNELTEAPKKKFSHSTKRNKRPVNPELLKIPEDELEFHMHTFPIKDLIRLREHKERIETNYTDEDATYYNYRTHMKMIPRVKWTKQDTQLFYEAIQQLGIDLSMVKECFPGRTREQINSKYKKECKQNRLRIESALNTHAKGHSQFNIVIERLKHARAEDKDEVQLAADVIEGGGLEKGVKYMESDENLTSFDDYEDDDDPWSRYKSEI